MSSYDKVVKLACKPKAAPPKAKYLDPIIAATWSEDGAVHDVCKALSPRFREPNAVIVFKALIVLHTMIRNGATDNVLSYLSSGDVLRLRNVGQGQWEGYDTPQNLARYAFYLDSRVRAYRDLKHDAVRVQSESNRDMRVSQSVEENRVTPPSGPQRSKTIMGRKLRSMTVEKGLLRETKAVHAMVDALIECKFYLDDLEDELTITALRMLVKDLLVLFQAGNEGVINVLEHYFEMSHVDAEQALAIYRHFCKQTVYVVEYLGVARKLQNLLNVPIPNLKHAPISLAGALEEYLNDPNFEQNRLEYKANKAAADGNASTQLKSVLKKGPKTPSSPTPPVPKPKLEAPAESSSSSLKPEANQAMVDFFSSIETEQQNMFNPRTGSPSSQYFQHQTTYNPFVQRQSMAIPLQMTGVMQQPFVQPQQTGFFPPQQPAFPTSPFPQVQQRQGSGPFLQPQSQVSSPFLQPQSQGSSPFLQPQSQGSSLFQQQRQSAFLQPQSTGFLQPQTTGSNPFRQSMLFPQSTGFSPFAIGGNLSGSGPGQSASIPSQPLRTQGTGFTGSPTASQYATSPLTTSPTTNSNLPFAMPNRPQSTPIPSQQTPSQSLTAVVTHQTGSKNPFGIPVAPAPPVPKPPTLQELAAGPSGGGTNAPSNGITFGNGPVFGNGPAGGSSGPGQTGMNQTEPRVLHPNGHSTSAGSAMASVASSFASKPVTSAPTGSGIGSSNPFPNLAPQHTATTSNLSDFSSLSSNATGSTSPTTAPSISSIPQQQTGFGGIKPFKPSSSFGANLLESLPPIAGSPATSSSNSLAAPDTQSAIGTGAPGLPSTNNPAFSFDSATSGFKNQPIGVGALNAQPTGPPTFGATGRSNSGLGAQLRPQMTGSPNPFRASMMMANPTFGAISPSQPPTSTTASAFPSSNLFNNQTGTTSSFTGNTLGGPTGQSPFGMGASNPSKQQNAQLVSTVTTPPSRLI